LKVLLLTRYGRLGASSRLRAYQYVPYLEANGFRVTTLPLFGDYYQADLYQGHSRRWGRIAVAFLKRLLQLARTPGFDLLWIEYEIFPWLPPLLEGLLKQLRIPFVVDYDDAIYYRYELQPSRIGRLLLAKKIDRIMRYANVVIVGNAFLGERAREVGAARVELLPTVVDTKRYPVAAAARNAVFTIGWIGSPSTVKYLSPIGPALADVCRGGMAQLVVVGARALELDGIRARFRPWSEATEVEDIRTFDVGIMPLPDAPWERGKCGYKLIQYMAGTRPVIASPVGINREIVEPGINGFLARTEQEWRDAIVRLAASPELRQRLGKAGRQKVEREYSLEVAAPRFAAILRSAVEPRLDAVQCAG